MGFGSKKWKKTTSLVKPAVGVFQRRSVLVGQPPLELQYSAWPSAIRTSSAMLQLCTLGVFDIILSLLQERHLLHLGNLKRNGA